MGCIPSRVVIPGKWVTLVWRCVLELQSDYQGPSSPKEIDFTPVAGSAQDTFSSLPWGAAAVHFIYWLHGTIGFPSLQGFQQSLPKVSPLCSTLHFIPLSMCLRLQVLFVVNDHGMDFLHPNCIPSWK